MSNQDPIDPPQLLVDDPGTLANADPNDLEDRHPSDNASRPLLLPTEAIDLVQQQIAVPPNLNRCCYRQEVDCNCHSQIRPPTVPPPKDLGYGRIPPEERRTIEEFVNDHKAAREAAIQSESLPTAIPLASPKPRSPTGHKDPGGNSRSVMLSDAPFEHQFNFGNNFSYPMPDISSNTKLGPVLNKSNLVEREHEVSLRQHRHSGLHARVYDDPKITRSTSATPLTSPTLSPSKLKRTNTAMEKPSKFPYANVTRNKRHKAKQSIKDNTLSLPSSPIVSNWSESIRGTPVPHPSPITSAVDHIPSAVDNSVIDISSGESVTSESDYTSDNTIRQPSPPPPNQLQIPPVQMDPSLKNFTTPNFTTPNPETYSTPNAEMDISSPQITSIHRDYLYPKEYDVGNGPHWVARKIFNGRGKDEVLFTKDCIEEVAQDSKKIQKLQTFKDSILAIDAGDEDGRSINAPHNYQRAQSVPLPDRPEEHESARLSIEYVTIPVGRSPEEIQKVVIDSAMAINTMLLNEQKSLRRLEYSISQNIVQSTIQGLVSQDAQSIHKGISKMFDNFSIMTRAVEGSEEQTRLNNDYAVNTHKHQAKLLEKFESLYKVLDLNSQQRFAEIEKALLHQNKLIIELSNRKDLIQTKANNQPIQPIPSFSSLHPQTVISHTCNANASPEILEGIKSLTNTVSSLTAQVASMRSSMEKMEKQLAGKSVPTITTAPTITTQAQGPTRHIPQRTITPRPLTPRPSTPIQMHPAQGSTQQPPLINPNIKPKGAPGRPELYEDQAPNAFIAELSQGANWFLERAIKAPDDQIHSWARVLSATNWGYLSQNGFPLLCKPILEVQCKRNFIILSIMRAFDSIQGCHKFLVPPSYPVPTTDVNEMCNYYTFTFSSGLRPPPTRRGRITPSYYPGWTPEEVKAKLDHNAKMRNPKSNPNLQVQPKTVSFANVAAGKKTNEVPKVLQKQNAQLDWSADDGRIDSDFGSDEVFYEDLYGNGSNLTPFTTNNPNILAQNQSAHQAPKPTAPINPRTKRPAFQNRQIYTLRFSR